MERQVRFDKYSLWLSIMGLLSWIFVFPDGIFSCFILDSLAITSGIISRRDHVKSGLSTAGIFLSIIGLVLSLLAFYGLYTIYDSLNDPELGPQITRYILDMLEQNGLSADVLFGRMH